MQFSLRVPTKAGRRMPRMVRVLHGTKSKC